MAKLSDKMELFCNEYIIDFNATQSAKKELRNYWMESISIVVDIMIIAGMLWCVYVLYRFF